MIASTKSINLSSKVDKALPYAVSFLFLIVCANVKIMTPWSAVPVGLHTLAILVMGCLLPFRIAFTTFLAYVVHGLIGAPLFGASLMVIATGYYVGMAVALYFLSVVCKNIKTPIWLNLVIASVIILSFGALYLQYFVGFQKALQVGVVPFLVGDTLKATFAYSLIKKAHQKNLVIS